MPHTDFEEYDFTEDCFFQESKFDQDQYDCFIKQLKVVNQESDNASDSTQEASFDQSVEIALSVEECISTESLEIFD